MYIVKVGDLCSVIEVVNGLVDGDLDMFNKRKIWGWVGCSKFWFDFKICFSLGILLMFFFIVNVVCGL